MSIRVGTRGSALATTQSGHVARRLEELTGRDVELVRIRTDGDVLKGSLAAMGGTGVFVTALREALLDDRCDVAVHSLKDLPTQVAPGLTFVTPERENPRDALCARDGATLTTLPRGARVGTGSPRRAAQLRSVRPDLDVVDIRGNVDTRLRRVHGPEADLHAVVLAYAGLSRISRLEEVTEVIDTNVMAPAPGQGALAVEVRTATLDDAAMAEALRELDHAPTRLAVLAERALLARLEAGCAAPVGAHGTLAEGALTLTAVVARVDGTEQLTHSARVTLPGALAGGSSASNDDVARQLGVRVGDALLADGAASLAPLRAYGAGGDAPRAEGDVPRAEGDLSLPDGDVRLGEREVADDADDAAGAGVPARDRGAHERAVEAARANLRDGGYRGERA